MVTRASVVIAAHDEAGVIDTTLSTLLADAGPGDLDVTVVANGCKDDTAGIARRREVRVLVTSVASKSNALNLADEVAVGYPRAYLDADIPVRADQLYALCGALSQPDALVAYPRRELDLRGRPPAVRAYFAVHRHLPVFRDSLVGRGLIVVSEAGRGRFEDFPDMIADDLFLDSLFTALERRLVTHVATVVATPFRTSDLLRRLVRVRRGNIQLRGATDAARSSDRWSWLRDVVLPRPWLLPAAGVYVALTVMAEWKARRPGVEHEVWGRDASTR